MSDKTGSDETPVAGVALCGAVAGIPATLGYVKTHEATQIKLAGYFSNVSDAGVIGQV